MKKTAILFLLTAGISLSAGTLLGGCSDAGGRKGAAAPEDGTTEAGGHEASRDLSGSTGGGSGGSDGSGDGSSFGHGTGNGSDGSSGRGAVGGSDGSSSGNGSDGSSLGTRVAQAGPYGEISLSLPDGWSYDTCLVDDELMSMNQYGIRFSPPGVTKGWVELDYCEFFGVCGTGLDEQPSELAGCPVRIGTYDNHPYWDYITFEEDCDGLVALTCDVTGWWSDYGDTVLSILDTAAFDVSVREGGAWIYEPESEIPEIGLQLSLKQISRTGATLVFSQYDPDAPSGELQYGEDFTLERQNGDTWEDVPVAISGSYGFHLVAYLLPAGETAERELSWEWLYGELPPGTYRICKTVTDFREDGRHTDYTIRSAFLVN